MSSDESISNFPPTSKIFEETTIPSTRRKKKQLSAISKAELMGGFQPTTDDIVESSRTHNPFDFPISQRSNQTPSSYSSFETNNYFHVFPTNDPFIQKKKNLESYVLAETTRLLYEDHQQYLCAHTRNELKAASICPLGRLRRQMFRMGLL